MTSRLQSADHLRVFAEFAHDRGDVGWAALAHRASLTLLDEVEAMALEQAWADRQKEDRGNGGTAAP